MSTKGGDSLRSPAPGKHRGGRARRRGKEEGAPSAPYLRGISCRLRVELPAKSWLYQITMAHPGQEVRFVHRSEMPGGMRRAELLVRSPDPAPWVRDLKRLEFTVDVSAVVLSDGESFINYLHRNPALDALFAQKGLLWKFPFPVQDGNALCEVIGTYPNILRTIEDLAGHSFRIHLESVGNQTIEDFEAPSEGSSSSGVVQYANPLEGMYGRVLSFSSPPEGGQGPRSRHEPTPSTPPSTTETSPSSPAGTGHLVVCRLRLMLPPRLWARVFSQRFPETSEEIVGQLVIDEQRTMVDVRLRSSMVRDWAAEIRKLPGVLEVEPLGTAGYSTTLRVTFASHPLYRRFVDLNLMWRLPSPVKDGALTIVMVGRDESIRTMIEDWQGAGLSATVESVRHQEEEPRTILTPRQEEIFRRALNAGYYDVPRKVTLSQLAVSMGMAVSSLSEILAVVEKKLLYHAEHGS